MGSCCKWETRAKVALARAPSNPNEVEECECCYGTTELDRERPNRSSRIRHNMKVAIGLLVLAWCTCSRSASPEDTGSCPADKPASNCGCSGDLRAEFRKSISSPLEQQLAPMSIGSANALNMSVIPAGIYTIGVDNTPLPMVRRADMPGCLAHPQGWREPQLSGGDRLLPHRQL